jgi:hypothetical protein
VHLKLSYQKSLKFGKPIHYNHDRSIIYCLSAKTLSRTASLKEVDSFYDYEKELDKIWQDLGRAVLESNISEVPADRRKKTLSKFGKISIKQSPPF